MEPKTGTDRVPLVRELLQRWMREGLQNRIAVNARDGSVLVYVPAGAFEMGSVEGEGGSDERPRHRVELSGYWIGVYAVSNGQYLKFVEATGHRAPDQSNWTEAPAIWRGKSFPPEKADHPGVCVSWEDAVAYAQWAGCELASEAQWEKACRGPLGLEYPWGSGWERRLGSVKAVSVRPPGPITRINSVWLIIGRS